MLKKERPKETGKQETLNNILQQNHNQPTVMAQQPVQQIQQIPKQQLLRPLEPFALTVETDTKDMAKAVVNRGAEIMNKYH